MAETLLDSDVLVDQIRGARRLGPLLGAGAYSVVTRCELYAGRPNQEQVVDRLLAPMIELPVDRPVAERAGRLRREAGLATPDALIAATALQHSLPLCTRNRRDFDRVPALALRDPD